MIFIPLLSIYIKIIKIYPGIFGKVAPRYELNSQRKHSLSTDHAHVKISDLYYEGNRSYTLLNDRG